MAREVLVVEDEPDIRRLIVLHLERDGFRCRTAANGPEALREVKAAVPDLVVLDLMLPQLDGLEVCRRLRSDASTAGVPIIMLTAKSDEVDRVVGLEVGADDYVGTPFSPKELVARGAPRVRRGRRCGRAEGADLPGAPDLYDGGPEDDPPGHPAHPRLALPRARGRPRDQHRRDGGLPGREQDGAAHARVALSRGAPAWAPPRRGPLARPRWGPARCPGGCGGAWPRAPEPRLTPRPPARALPPARPSARPPPPQTPPPPPRHTRP